MHKALIVNGRLMSYIIPEDIYIFIVGFKFLRKNRGYSSKGRAEPMRKTKTYPLKHNFADLCF